MSEMPEQYTAEQIKVLEGLSAVRKRPAMYIGHPSVEGLHHLVHEWVDNSIDEALAGHCDKIEVIIHIDNSVTVRDNGRGIPVDIHEKEKRPAVEVARTKLEVTGKTKNTGTQIRFKPDSQIFETLQFSFDILSQRLRELAFLNKGLSISIEDERSGKRHDFFYKGGILSFIEFLNKNKNCIHPKPIYVQGGKNGLDVG